MGEIPLFDKEQQLIFDQITTEEKFRKHFYFTGGTVLSSFYLQHRYSEDLDFFSENKFDENEILAMVNSWANKYQFTFKNQLNEVVYMFFLTFKNKKVLKVDFGYYPHKRVEKGTIVDGIMIDSLFDIAINKLATVNQRSSVKDFVDLYYLLDKFTIWDLINGVKVKFKIEIDHWILASDMIDVVEKFDFMPRMIKPLTLEELKIFYRQKGKELGMKQVEK